MADEPVAGRWSSDGGLQAALTDLGGRLRYPSEPGPELAGAVSRAIEAGRPSAADAPVAERLRRRIERTLRERSPARRALVLAVAVVLVLAGLAAATTLGVRGVRIVFGPGPAATGPAGGTMGPTPAGLGDGLFLGRRMTLAQARERVRFPVTVPTIPGLGTPSVFVSDAVAGGVVNLVYPAAPGVPAEGRSGVGIVVTEFLGQAVRPYLVKFAGARTTIEDVRVGDGAGIWVSGPPHQIAYLLPDGMVATQTLRLSGDVLLWQRADVTMRLESLMTKDRAIAVAGSMR